MSDYLNISDFLSPVNKAILSNDEGYTDSQLGLLIDTYEESFPDITNADIIIIGCGEYRGAGIPGYDSTSPDTIRHELYSLYKWHKQLHIADLGNIKPGKSVDDTYAAMRMVLKELITAGKFVFIIGGSHDMTMAQYQANVLLEKQVEVVTVDTLIDMNMDAAFPAQKFLMELLTGEPNCVRQYSHIAFQSYYVHPQILETLDRLRVDCFRTGDVKQDLEEMEPIIRSSEVFSFDISAIAHAYAPANKLTPNGLNGEESCQLLRYAGMATALSTAGIYGYKASQDKDNLTARQIAHMLWYGIDGYNRRIKEASLEDKDSFNEFNTALAEVATSFIQSRKSGRWWMQLPEGNYVPCSFKDYIQASNNEMPERWLRILERS